MFFTMLPLARQVNDGLALRPWLPWLSPAVFVTLWMAALHILERVALDYCIAPTAHPLLLVTLCAGVGALTVPLYRAPHVAGPFLLLGVLYLMGVTQYTLCFLFARLSRCVAIALGLPALAMLLYMTMHTLSYTFVSQSVRSLHHCAWTISGGGCCTAYLLLLVVVCLLTAF